MAIFDLSKKSPSRYCPESQTTFPSPFWGVFCKKKDVEKRCENEKGFHFCFSPNFRLYDKYSQMTFIPVTFFPMTYIPNVNYS